MAAPFPTDNPYLNKGFEPIRFECDYADLMVEGEIPPELCGCLYRIGPNPQFAPRGFYNPLLGDGMIHAFDIQRGRVAYRNRWVRTQQWQHERAAGRSLFATSGNPREADPAVAGLRTDGVANTNLCWHAGRLLALEEGHAPVVIDPVTLETLGVWTFDGELPGNMTAHPKIDPDTGEMVFFANFPGGDLSGLLELYVADASGCLIRRRRIAGPFPSLVHDFAVTRDFVVFVVCPLTVSVERARSGAGSAIAWEPEKPTWIGVVPRQSVSMDVKWFHMPASMVWHVMNAFNQDDEIYLDVCQQEAAAFPSVSGTPAEKSELQQFLTRWRLELSGRAAVAAERLSDVVCEYPRLDERRCGRYYRYGYVACSGGPGTDDLFHRAIGRFDHEARRMDVYHAGNTCAVSEPVFVHKNRGCAEGEGYLLAVVFDELRNASRLAIFDAQDVAAGPLALALLDHRVPMGFHGTWRPHGKGGS
jgi:carotenoid cleavage dioxygenase-like enzyme